MPDATLNPTPASGEQRRWTALFLAWLVALAASLGALFIGEVMGQAPCSLCWYQRIFMFPLAVLLGIACYRGDTGIGRYALPLAAIGWLLAGWHALLFYGLVAEAVQPCSAAGPACDGAGMLLAGLVPLPLLSLAAFSLLLLLLSLAARGGRQP
ncbi:disulfide bond formation protein B [Pseudoroseomonas cervicalis]|uniref:Disulfide bond formation protein DsbB n=1 Tax=Pseudoroseomonas cervicalis ATCC 49957 TaxID=525371 RepID=D5RIC0_9PROT|nr:disulfide bond formation protein B [Pseudoroseomonas cervicalis]EFH12947.1 disulfide bond formation protein DsbB [Pseudoroseomonas cervicalis ATCC 49957]